MMHLPLGIGLALLVQSTELMAADEAAPTLSLNAGGDAGRAPHRELDVSRPYVGCHRFGFGCFAGGTGCSNGDDGIEYGRHRLSR